MVGRAPDPDAAPSDVADIASPTSTTVRAGASAVPDSTCGTTVSTPIYGTRSLGSNIADPKSSIFLSRSSCSLAAMCACAAANSVR
eukprot:6049695-Alexandrium_andersonii.AAC.1